MTRPTISQAQSWQPDSLREAADAWDAAAGDAHREFDVVVRGVQDTRDFWSGDAANAARDRAAKVAGEAGKLSRALVAAAVAARDGAEQIAAARDDVLKSVAAVRSLGFIVADDGSVTPPAVPPPAVLATAGGDVVLAQDVLHSGAEEFTHEIGAKLDALGAADDDAAHDVDDAFHGVITPEPTTVNGVDTTVVAKWPSMSQDDIRAQIAAMTPQQRGQLVELCPQQVGNTDGVPWDIRIAANRINIAQAILDSRGDQRRVAFYQSLLGEVADPTGKGARVQRKVLAFDPGRSSFVELIGDLGTAKNVGVLVPGMNTTIEGSKANTDTAARFVNESRGDLAMVTYLGGPFPQGGFPDGLDDAMDTRYALDMAPRLVSFSEDVNHVADGLGRDVGVTYIGHSYGGSILGTAEAMGLTADRTLYLEAAGAGVGVEDVGDYHDRNPDVMRFSMTAPGDWIDLVQGLSLNPHGADPDGMAGVIHLATGNYDSGGPVGGFHSHGDVLDRPSDAWRNIYAIMTNQPYSVHLNPLWFMPPWLRPTG
ncbi:MAG TPA: alpha/beta hydrolase [Mycobacterium sp.]|nr:alpha/beta hydrolase [Mycobacterium sp.]